MLRCFNRSARKSSPCSACGRQKRDKIRPARLAVVKNETKFALLGLRSSKTRQNSPCIRKISEKAAFRASWASFVPKCALLLCAGQVLSRNCCWRGRAGRVSSRLLALCSGVRSLRHSPLRQWWGHHTKPSYSLSPACWTLVSCIFPAAQCRIRLCGRGVPSCADGGAGPRCTRASRTAITKPPGARPGGGGAGDGNRTRL